MHASSVFVLPSFYFSFARLRGFVRDLHGFSRTLQDGGDKRRWRGPTSDAVELRESTSCLCGVRWRCTERESFLSWSRQRFHRHLRRVREWRAQSWTFWWCFAFHGISGGGLSHRSIRRVSHVQTDRLDVEEQAHARSCAHHVHTWRRVDVQTLSRGATRRADAVDAACEPRPRGKSTPLGGEKREEGVVGKKDPLLGGTEEVGKGTYNSHGEVYYEQSIRTRTLFCNRKVNE